ncbi:MAG TPA: LLM class F420-dependent oxidoreductase [Nocardioides sp.]|uniref:LLM class F420-dependent oxidoreductase n=1 Tax=Nocardioides sp. TaxID=35761 RepID=UPI002E32A93E|nr:LLM class F420-dependent oxidoreductase [Nocardioides sp.]HEX3929687.1 LLM class F420-dependent oxidoreductase [Nocardioides sp.]
MKAGVHIFLTDETTDVRELATDVEARGFESLWLPEHTHIPTSRESEWYRGRELPREYARTLDPFVALTAAALSTTSLKVATGICLVAQHDPILTAKAVSTLDLLSGGRFVFGVGLGWNLEEMRDHGVDPATRRSHVKETVQAMQGLWTEERFGYDGRFVSFSESWLWPKPVQRPWPPIVVGGRGSPRAFRDIAEYADGWMPDINMFRPEKFPPLLDELAEACREHGRDPVPVSAMGGAADPQRIEELAQLGLERIVFLLPSGTSDAVARALDEIATALAAAGHELEPA